MSVWNAEVTVVDPDAPPLHTYLVEWGGMEATFEAATPAKARWQAARALCEAGYVPRPGDAFKRPMTVRKA
jgi:hypothetical protein